MNLLEKTLNDDGEYEVKLNGRMLFVAEDNETINFIGERLVELAEADDYATLVLG